MKKNIRRILVSIVTLAMVLGSAAVMQTVKAENTPGIEVTIDLSNAETSYWDYDTQKYYPAYFLDGGTLPIVTVTYNGDPLTEGVDYSVTYYNWTMNETSDLPHLEGRYSLQVSNYYGSEYTFSEGSEMFGIVKRPTYNIIYNANNGTDDFKVTYVKYGSLPSEQDIPEFVYEGHTFVGWYTDAACSDGNEFDIDSPYKGEGASTANVLNVYAKWKADEVVAEKYYLHFYKNDGTDEYQEVIVEAGQVPASVPEYENDGFDFAGWYTDAACSDGKEFDEKAAYNGEGANNEHILNVYAKWTESTPDEPVEPDVPVVGDDWKITLGFSLMIFSWIYMAYYVMRRNRGLVR